MSYEPAKDLPTLTESEWKDRPPTEDLTAAKTNLTPVFWGLLIVVLDFSFNGFDILLDGVGYLLVAIGCGGLTVFSPRFGSARLLSWLLAVLWLVGFAIHGEIARYYGLAATVVNCAMMWHLLGGIVDLTSRRNRLDLATRAGRMRIAYVAVILAATALEWSDSVSREMAPLATVLVIALLVVLVIILHLIHRVRADLAH
ncbi:MAG: hypothetical protein RIC55_22605 [Pirellulaceae bacterium]